jgi:hypothetical protein
MPSFDDGDDFVWVCGPCERSWGVIGFVEELLRPGIIHALGNAFAPAKLGDRGFTAKAIEHNAGLLFRRMVLRSCPSDVADNAFLATNSLLDTLIRLNHDLN